MIIVHEQQRKGSLFQLVYGHNILAIMEVIPFNCNLLILMNIESVSFQISQNRN